jgi:hypothetical protein
MQLVPVFLAVWIFIHRLQGPQPVHLLVWVSLYLLWDHLRPFNFARINLRIHFIPERAMVRTIVRGIAMRPSLKMMVALLSIIPMEVVTSWFVLQTNFWPVTTVPMILARPSVASLVRLVLLKTRVRL